MRCVQTVTFAIFFETNILLQTQSFHQVNPSEP